MIWQTASLTKTAPKASSGRFCKQILTPTSFEVTGISCPLATCNVAVTSVRLVTSSLEANAFEERPVRAEHLGTAFEGFACPCPSLGPSPFPVPCPSPLLVPGEEGRPAGQGLACGEQQAKVPSFGGPTRTEHCIVPLQQKHKKLHVCFLQTTSV